MDNHFNSFEDLAIFAKKNLPLPERITARRDDERNRVSKRELDLKVREIMQNNPELSRKIFSAFLLLKKIKKQVPVAHITSKRIRCGNDEYSPGFVEKIEQEGFKPRFTNVGAFIVRENVTRLAKPDDFIEDPSLFIKNLLMILKNFRKHGRRTNKEILGSNKDKGVGDPIMFIIEAGKMEQGSDYDNHFVLTEAVPSDKIIGGIDIDGPLNDELLLSLAEDILGDIQEYYSLEAN